MGIENNTHEIEVQNQELQRANREQIEQANQEHEELGKVLDGLDTLDNEAELDEISENEDISEQDDTASQLDNNDKIEDETSEQFETINNPVYNEVENNGFSINDVNQAVDAKEAYEAEIRDMSQDEYHAQKELDQRVEENGSEPNMTEPSVLGNDLHQEEVSNKETDNRSRLNEPEQNAVDMERSTEETPGNDEIDDSLSDVSTVDESNVQEVKLSELPDNVQESYRKYESDAENPEDVEDTDNVEKGRYESENPETADKVRDITSSYYDQAGELARNNEMGRAFTDHKEDHVEMVADKSLEAGDAIKGAVENGNLGNNAGEDRVSFSSDIDKKTLEGAALSHDTGMSGNGYALTPAIGEDGKQMKDENGKKMYEKDGDGNYVIHPETNSNFNEVRENHSLNSAINVLSNRDQYKDAGYSDEQVDKMAAECMAHSKSSSGVADLNSKEDWSDCFDRIDSTVDAYNKDHPDSQISFNRSNFEGDNDKLGSLASETLALRVGDVSRDSFAGAEAQSGECVHVDRSTIDNHAGSVEGELKNADITIGENREPIDNMKSRQVHAGEQNISDNHTFVGDNGNLTHEITVADGSSAPKCTQAALGDHIGELASAKDEKFDVYIKFNKECDNDSIKSYDQFDSKMYDKYGDQIIIHYPWDEVK